MVAIITRSKSARFKPHFNRTTGRYYGTSREYYSDLKKRGLEPYNPNSVTKHKPKPYKPSQWAHDMVEAGRGGKVGDVWKEEVAKKGGFKAPPPGVNLEKGGFTEGGV